MGSDSDFLIDKKVRDQALDSLQAYLSAQSEISELDLLKTMEGTVLL